MSLYFESKKNKIVVEIIDKRGNGMNIRKITAVLWMTVFLVTACSETSTSVSGSASETESVSERLTTDTGKEEMDETKNVSVSEKITESVTEESSAENVWEELRENFEKDVRDEYNEKEERIRANKLQWSSEKDAPCVLITTEGEKKIRSDKDYLSAICDVFNCGEEYELSALCGIRIRGNSSANDPVKPYRIKFEKKQNMLGLHDGKKFKSWVLLKCNWNMLSDPIAWELCDAMFEGEYYVSDYSFVNLYINQEYQGLYLLCEQNQAGKGRVEVVEPVGEEAPEEIGYFLEMDNYAGREHPHFKMKYGSREITDISEKTQEAAADDYSIKSDTTTQSQRDFIEKYMNNLFEIVYAACVEDRALMFDENYDTVDATGILTPKEAVEAVMDTESVIDMLIMEELAHNYDVGAGSFFMAVDFSQYSRYPRLTFLAPWDFNWAYEDDLLGGYYAATFQEPQDAWDRSNIWFIVMMKADWFREDVLKHFDRYVEDGRLTERLDSLDEYAEQFRADLGDESWRVDCGKDLCNKVRNRINHLDKYRFDFPIPTEEP